MEAQQRRLDPSNASEWEKQPPSSSSSSINSIQPSQTSTSDSDVMFKLLAFTAAMVILPLGSYWFTLNYVFQGYNYTKAGITAIAVAHGVLFLYIYVAMKEDSETKQLKKQQ